MATGVLSDQKNLITNLIKEDISLQDIEKVYFLNFIFNILFKGSND